MDVAVAPYPRLDEFYFSPLKLYEYLAAGVPVVAGDAGNLPELLAGPDGPLGITYPAGSVDDLAATIALLRAGPELRADLARRGRADALESHDWSQVLARVLGLLEVRHGAVPA
jgi:glycosyltransferase involved in cell wall biosynthesis